MNLLVSMKLSQFFTKTSKTAAADADSINAKFLTQAGFIYKQMAGVYIFLPLGLRVLNKIEQIIREEMNVVGGNEVLMPALTLEENYEITGRDKTMADIFYHTSGAGESKIVLNPTHEEIVTPLVQKFVFSYQDLPRSVYQFQTKFRNEARAKSGLLRGREFRMKDMYSFHADEKDLDNYYDEVIKAYFKVYDRLGLGNGRTILTYASGGAFCKYSHEYQTLAEAGEDTIYICEKCNVAVNKEIAEEQNVCPKCGNKALVEKKAIEVGNIFKLMDKFTKPFKFFYQDEKGTQQVAQMGCYGIGPSRIMGTIVEVFNDEKGIIWPESVAPYKVCLMSLGKEEESREEAEKIYKKLLAKGVEVLFDDRENASAGEKLADADLIGLPYRVVVSKKTMEKGGIELKMRNSEDSKIITVEELLKIFSL